MAKITIEELSGSLKEYLNGLGLTEAQVQELIDKFEDEKIGDISQLSTEEKGSLVGAINELFQSANNGKELIANAIGEPVSSEDTFSAMSDDINSLLSTFKTNMMNNGITVESNDKFKSLIDKIATMVEEGSNKGIQYASGNSSSTSKCEASLNFKPILVLVQTGEGMIIYLESYSTNSVVYAFYDSYVQISTLASIGGYVNETGFLFGQISGASWFNWYAIGVGEEDTTLRDSLASILEEEGVDVTEEDDMASLISKVDEEFDRKNANAVSLISGTSYTLLNSTELDVYNEMINKEVLYTHNYPGGVIKFSTLIENMGRTDSDGWYTAYNSTYLVVNHIRNGETISSVTYRHKIAYEDYGENEVEQSVDYTVENGDILQFLGNAPQGVSYCIPYIKLTADIQW